MAEENIVDGEETPEENINQAEFLKKIEKDLPEEVKKLIEDLPSPQKSAVEALLVAISVKKTSWKSPIPPPDILEGYNKIIPHGAERLLKMVENQSEHRMAMEKKIIPKEVNQSIKGQWMGLTIAISFLVCATFLIYTGHGAEGTILGSADLVALVSLFIYGKRKQQNNPEKN